MNKNDGNQQIHTLINSLCGAGSKIPSWLQLTACKYVHAFSQYLYILILDNQHS